MSETAEMDFQLIDPFAIHLVKKHQSTDLEALKIQNDPSGKDIA